MCTLHVCETGCLSCRGHLTTCFASEHPILWQNTLIFLAALSCIGHTDIQPFVRVKVNDSRINRKESRQLHTCMTLSTWLRSKCTAWQLLATDNKQFMVELGFRMRRCMDKKRQYYRIILTSSPWYIQNSWARERADRTHYHKAISNLGKLTRYYDKVLYGHMKRI